MKSTRTVRVPIDEQPMAVSHIPFQRRNGLPTVQTCHHAIFTRRTQTRQRHCCEDVRAHLPVLIVFFFFGNGIKKYPPAYINITFQNNLLIAKVTKKNLSYCSAKTDTWDRFLNKFPFSSQFTFTERIPLRILQIY